MATKNVTMAVDGRGFMLGYVDAMGNADVSKPFYMADYADKSVILSGTWGSATIVVQGSQDATVYFTLKDINGNNASFTADGAVAIGPNVPYIRFSSSGGTGTDVNCSVVGTKRG